MAATTGQPAHVSGQSQHGLIAGDQYAPVQLQEQPVDTPVVAEVSATPPNSKLKLTIIAVIAIVIIVAVVILVARIEFEDTWTQDPNYGEGWGDCGCFMDNSTFYPEWDEVCGMS